MTDAPVTALAEYLVEIGGMIHTLQLSDEDAKRYGDAAVKAETPRPNKAAARPANKEG